MARTSEDQSICAVRVSVSCDSQPRYSRCHDQSWSRSRVLLALRQQPLFPAVATNPRVANCHPSFLQRTRVCCPPKRTVVGLDSGDLICGSGNGTETDKANGCSRNQQLARRRFKNSRTAREVYGPIMVHESLLTVTQDALGATRVAYFQSVTS
jgi:hypothetical protein